jgi:hypothetical protein
VALLSLALVALDLLPRPFGAEAVWPHPERSRAAYAALVALPPGPVLEAPWGPDAQQLFATESLNQLASTLHWRPLLNGFTAYPPGSYQLLLRAARGLPGAAGLAELGRLSGLRWIVVHRERLTPDARRAWLASRSELHALLRWVASFPDKGRLLSHLLGGERAPGDWEALDRSVGAMHKRFYANPSGPGWDEVRASLEALRDLAKARGIELHVVIFPESDQLGDAPNLDPQARWTALCVELSLSCVDLQPAFARATARGEAELFLDTQHPNARGLALSALATAEFLAS